MSQLWCDSARKSVRGTLHYRVGMDELDGDASQPPGPVAPTDLDTEIPNAETEITLAQRERTIRRRQVIEIGVSLALLVLLFGVILPQVIDYEQVWESVKSLTFGEFFVLFLLGFVRIGVSAAQHAALIPSLKFRVAAKAYLASGTLAELAPPPGDLAVRYGMYRAQGVDPEAAGVGIMLTGLFDNAAKLLLPVVALGVLVLTGFDDATLRQMFLIGLAAAVGLGFVIAFIVRSESFTLAFGRLVGHIISGLLIRFGKNPLEDLGTKAVGMRTRASGTFRQGWPRASAATLGVHVMNFTILVVAMRYVGVTTDDVDWVTALLAYSVVVLLTALPLTPGGLGVSALGYTWLLAPGDPALASLIASASLLNKVFTWLLPIVVGIIPVVQWRRSTRSDGSATSGSTQTAG